MAQDKVFGSKLSKFYDRDAIPGVKFDAATQLAIVKDNLSPARDGRLRVWVPEFGGNENNPLFWRTVNYASPYMGSTYQPSTSLNNSFTGTTHTYGMWMTPPDIGNQVLCTFANGDPERGFWFACVAGTLSNWMLPAIGTSTNVDKTTVSTDIKASILPDNHVPPQVLPVAEFNEHIDGTVNSTFYANKKPIHEFQANILFRQGLDRDPVRGAITSSSQRETPSHVFGISTPGRALTKDPADDPGYAEKVAAGGIPADQYSVPTRKGGHTFVMDDGDVNGKDQLIRLRTAGGHQILMNDDQSTMYVAHKNGTSWIEIDDSGIKMYTIGDFSVRSEGNFNLHADKDINIQSGGSINIASDTAFTLNSAAVKIGGSESLLLYGTKTNIGAGQLVMSADGKLAVSSGGPMTVSGSTIDINGGSGGNSISMPTLEKNKLADTTYDSDVTKLWYSVPQSVDSVVTILPSHEPWTRTSPAAPLTKSAGSSVCAPPAGSPTAPASYSLPAPNGNKADNGKVNGTPVPWSTDTAFLDKVKSTAGTLNCNYMDLLACMANETGATFDPAITNSLGYTGLIQFGKAAASDLRTTTDALRQLNRADQMDWVLKFFQLQSLTQKAPAPKLQDLYLCIYWPAAVGKPDNFIINAADSKQAQSNKGLQAADGSITCASVGAAAAKWLPGIQQALANAGETGQAAPAAPAGAVLDGSGHPITSGSGQPVTSGAFASKDAGIASAAGQGVVQPTCPAEFLAKTTTYAPPGNFGATTPNLNTTQAKAMMAELGYFVSDFNYNYVSKDYTRIGKYGMDAQFLANNGYIKPDAIKQFGTNTLSKPVAWTGKDGLQSQDDFFSSPALQDSIMYAAFSAYYTELLANSSILPTDDVCTAAGMMFVAYQMRSSATAKTWRNNGSVFDVQGQDGAVYYNHGRYAIDILAAGGAVSSVAATVGLGGANTTGINPDDVFTFAASGTGTRAGFDQLSGEFKDAVLKMAQDFKAKTGAKIAISSSYRSQADQQQLIDRWHAAGGGPNNPTAGGITTPSLKKSAHSDGMAIDSGQMSLVARTVELSTYGLRWGGSFSKSDPVHIQLNNFPLQ